MAASKKGRSFFGGTLGMVLLTGALAAKKPNDSRNMGNMNAPIMPLARPTAAGARCDLFEPRRR
jgi:hypothetical protein